MCNILYREADLKPMDAEQLRECGHKMVDFVADYYKNIEKFPVLSQVQVFISRASLVSIFFGMILEITEILHFLKSICCL